MARRLLTPKIFINLNTTLPYIFAIILSSIATSTIRYQWKRFPNIGLRMAREIKKSARPLSSYDTALVVDREERWSLAVLSNLSA